MQNSSLTLSSFIFLLDTSVQPRIEHTKFCTSRYCAFCNCEETDVDCFVLEFALLQISYSYTLNDHSLPLIWWNLAIKILLFRVHNSDICSHRHTLFMQVYLYPCLKTWSCWVVQEWVSLSALFARSIHTRKFHTANTHDHDGHKPL